MPFSVAGWQCSCELLYLFTLFYFTNYKPVSHERTEGIMCRPSVIMNLFLNHFTVEMQHVISWLCTTLLRHMQDSEADYFNVGNRRMFLSSHLAIEEAGNGCGGAWWRTLLPILAKKIPIIQRTFQPLYADCCQSKKLRIEIHGISSLWRADLSSASNTTLQW